MITYITGTLIGTIFMGLMASVLGSMGISFMTSITMFGNCINIITDKNPDTFVSVLEGIPGLLILVAIGYAL